MVIRQIVFAGNFAPLRDRHIKKPCHTFLATGISAFFPIGTLQMRRFWL
jgi:hypothetical protein